MNTRRSTGLAMATLAVALAACSAHPAASRDPDLRNTGEEAALAVTVPAGKEVLPDWDRRPDGTAVLAIPSDLLFAKNAAVLDPAAVGVLAQVVAEVRGRQRSAPVPVLVEGHADSDGAAAYNQALSERRASAVAAWLAGHGVAAASITAVGRGEEQPAVEETDEATKARNRRVVVTVGA